MSIIEDINKIVERINCKYAFQSIMYDIEEMKEPWGCLQLYYLRAWDEKRNIKNAMERSINNTKSSVTLSNPISNNYYFVHSLEEQFNISDEDRNTFRNLLCKKCFNENEYEHMDLSGTRYSIFIKMRELQFKHIK